jgi:hypothetical protein
MRLLLTLASALAFLLAPGVAYAQTDGIQREVEVRLWIRRVLTGAQAATGVPSLVYGVTIIALTVILVAVYVWLRRVRRKRAIRQK